MPNLAPKRQSSVRKFSSVAGGNETTFKQKRKRPENLTPLKIPSEKKSKEELVKHQKRNRIDISTLSPLALSPKEEFSSLSGIDSNVSQHQLKKALGLTDDLLEYHERDVFSAKHEKIDINQFIKDEMFQKDDLAQKQNQKKTKSTVSTKSSPENESLYPKTLIIYQHIEESQRNDQIKEKQEEKYKENIKSNRTSQQKIEDKEKKRHVKKSRNKMKGRKENTQIYQEFIHVFEQREKQFLSDLQQHHSQIISVFLSIDQHLKKMENQ